ncbi:MAG: hypothetical protein ACJAUD_002267, partial [Crocinitomicaceae bacterium]
VLGISLLDKTTVNELFTKIDYKSGEESIYKQLEISLN